MGGLLFRLFFNPKCTPLSKHNSIEINKKVKMFDEVEKNWDDIMKHGFFFRQVLFILTVSWRIKKKLRLIAWAWVFR